MHIFPANDPKSLTVLQLNYMITCNSKTTQL
jgi:hypothetical protein